MTKRTARLFVLVAVMVLVAFALAACSSAAQTTEAPTTVPAQPTAASAQPTNTTAPAATDVAATPTEAATATKAPEPTAVPFTASIDILAINPHQGIQVARVDDPKTNFKLFTTGLNIVPPGVPQYVQAGSVGLAKDAKVDPASAIWTITTKPDGSNATIAAAPADEKTGVPEGAAVFTPDKTGDYVISLTVKDSAGAASQAGEQKFVVAQYAGSDTCKGCHAEAYDNWSKTGHAQFLKEMVDTNGEGEYAEAGFGCARCHSAGYYPITKETTGGWWDVFINKLKLDPKKDFGDKVAQAKAGTFDTFPAELKSVSNINCESCHGPGGAHVAGDKATTMAYNTGVSGSCDQCHNDGHFHTKGEQLQAAGHKNAGELTPPNGRAECARCHSGGGFLDNLAGKAPEEQRNNVTEIGCPVCHDPHKGDNFAQLRVVNDVKGVNFEIKNAGLSAVCMDCHNSNSDAATVATEKTTYPHYSAAAEAINGVGGFDFGLKIPNSPHVGMVGGSPVTVKDAEGKDVKLFGGEAPGACVYCHMYQTPGGPENATRTEPSEEINTETNPGHNLVGVHTFAMVAKQADGKTVDNVAACTSCHSDVTTFNFTAKADYDGNGKAEGVQDEVNGLLAVVKKAITDQGAEATDNYPYFKLPENPSAELKGAAYNYRYVIGVIPTGAGRASAIHNFQRSVALLQASYFKLAGQDVPNATILYEK